MYRVKRNLVVRTRIIETPQERKISGRMPHETKALLMAWFSSSRKDRMTSYSSEKISCGDI
jgi:hypothetical protein